MSIGVRVVDLLNMLRQLFSDEVTTYFAASRDYPEMADTPSYGEVKATFERLRGIYQPLFSDSTVLQRLSFSSVNNLVATAQNAWNAFSNVRANPDPNVFRAFAQQIDAFAYQTHTVGLEYLVSGGAAIEAVRSSLAKDQQAVQSALATLTQNNADVETLKNQIRNLITPAVAGSLSKSFTERRDSLARFRNVWLGIAGFIAVAAVAGLIYVGNALALLLAEAKTPDNFWLVLGLRFLFLLPVFALLGFALTQYRKERNFEEEYAHKAAVAVTLPNYGDLLQQGSVRDQIVSGAANVIFSSPVGQKTDSEGSLDPVAGAKELLETASKLMPWKR